MKRDLASVFMCLIVSMVSGLAFSHEGHSDESSPGKAHIKGAVGHPVKSTKVSRTIQISMDDQMRFNPEKILIKKGQTIKFAVTNIGKVKHEIVMGSVEEIKEHAEMMKQMPDVKHEDPGQLTLEPGTSGEMVWKFSEAGTLEYACLQPGHNEAGMNGKIKVQ